MKHLFRWNSGDYVGFISGDNVFDPDGNYLGWIESDGSAWKEDGTYLGELYKDDHIMRNQMKIEPIPRIPRIPPISPIPPIPPISRIGRIGVIGWDDVL